MKKLFLLLLTVIFITSCSETKYVPYYDKPGFKVYKPVSDKNAKNKKLTIKKNTPKCWF